MNYNKLTRKDWFVFFNTLLLFIVVIICLLPFVHLLAVSLSTPEAANAGEVVLRPIGFNLEAYRYLLKESAFIKALLVTLKRVFLGTTLSMIIIILTAYPLSKENSMFKMRTVYLWYFVFTMFFGGGLIPTYIIIKNLNLINTIWVLVLPTAMNVWHTLLLLNFFRGIPKELEEAAIIDGAGHITILTRIFIPISKPALATIFLFTIVGHWNSWFDGIIFMNTPDKYPLQSYLSTLMMQSGKALQITTPEMMQELQKLSEKTLRTAQIFAGALPIMIVYPFLQKHFVKGIVLGSVKE